MNEQERIGVFIRDMRVERGMTQQQLAEKLGITDKAVSKWERCVSYPDITLLRDLAAALGVSVAELLAGRRDEPPQPPQAVEDVVLDTVTYAEAARRKNGGWRFWAFIVLTAGCLIAALVLFIIYFAAGRRAGLLLAVKCVAFGWALCYPLLRLERRPVGGCLAVLSFAILPFLLQIRDSYPAHIYWIVILSVACLWVAYFLFLRLRMWAAAGGSFLLCGLLGYAINAILSCPANPANTITSVLAAGACFLIDFTLGRSHRE